MQQVRISAIWKIAGIKSATANDWNIDDKEQVRDLGIMMSNTATFTLHVINIVKKAWDKMWWVLTVESVSVSEVLSHVDTLEICHSPSTVLLPALESMETEDIQAIEAIQRTFTYKITEVQHLNYWEMLHELKLFFSRDAVNVIYVIIYIFGR